jgi:hypothetical protein
LGREPESYSATVVRVFERGEERLAFVTRVARAHGLERDEWTEEEHRLASIGRPDLGLTYLIDLDRNVYVEQSFTTIQPSADDLDGEEIERLFPEPGSGAVIERVRAGNEVVDGHPCVVYRSRVETLRGATSESTVWEAEDLGGLTVRSELRGPEGSRVVTELRDIRVPADPGLFELPADARKVEALDDP